MHTAALHDQQVLTLQVWNRLHGGLTVKLHLDFRLSEVGGRCPEALPCLEFNCIWIPRFIPDFLKQKLGLGWGGMYIF